MTSFPAIVPSSRAFTPGEYPVTSFGAYTGKQNRVRHSNVFIDAQLRLSFIGLSEADMLTIWSHYANKQGTFDLFGLPSQIVEGSSITNYVPSNYLWRYVADGSVEDLPCGGHNVTLTIEAVKVGFSTVIGIERIITVELIAGAGAAGEYIAGISQSVSLSLSAGTAIAALDGLAASITLSLAAGVADGDKSVSGISIEITLGLATGVAIVPPPDPEFANVALLLLFDATPIVDMSSNSNDPIAVNDVTVTSSESPFSGGSSAYFNGSSSFITIPNITLASSSDFTVEFWFYPEISKLHTLLLDEPNAFSNSRILVDNFNNLLTSSANTGPAVTIGAWNHLAFVRASSVETRYVDGVGSSASVGTAARVYDLIGNGSSVSGQFFWQAQGWLSNLRITTGVARYTANFTPPTAPFSTY